MGRHSASYKDNSPARQAESVQRVVCTCVFVGRRWAMRHLFGCLAALSHTLHSPLITQLAQ